MLFSSHMCMRITVSGWNEWPTNAVSATGRNRLCIWRPEFTRSCGDQTLKGVMGQVGEGPATLDDFFHIVQLDGDAFEYHGVQLAYFQNRHTPGKTSYGLWINERLLFSGDTRAIPEIVERFNPDVILHDSTLSEWNPVHASVTELLESYPDAVRRRMYLMSYEDHWEEYQAQIETEFAGFARQGQEFTL